MSDRDHEARIIGAARQFADLDSECWLENATAFTCDEIEVIAELIRAVGGDENEGVADAIVAQHATGDDEGDRHWNGEPTEFKTPEEATP